MNEGLLDTNVLVYAFSNDPRAKTALNLLEAGHAVSVQTLNEFTGVARGKLRKDWNWTHQALDRIRLLCRAIVPLDVPLHDHGIALAERYQVHIYDALIIAAALRCGSSVLWSEDMQDGQVMDGRLTIRNPFAG